MPSASEPENIMPLSVNEVDKMLAFGLTHSSAGLLTSCCFCILAGDTVDWIAQCKRSC